MNSRFWPASFFAAAILGILWSFCWFTTGALAQLPGAGLGRVQLSQPSTTDLNTPPARGEVFDADALEHAKTFCVDLNHLESSLAAGVKNFLTQESGPGKLLGRVPWRLVDDCTKADVVARIYFARIDVRAGLPGRWSRPGSQPVLLLYDKASIRLFYRAESQVFSPDEAVALRHPFAMLVKDLKKIDR